MKKALFILLSLAVAAFVYSAISGTAHDFSGNGWSGGEICVPCHTPHDSDTSISDAPLWNHEVQASTFQVYTSTTMTATTGQPSGYSELCLSCHDGSVAIDSFGGATGTNFVSAGNGLVGTDLRNDHPISFTYDDTLATNDGGLHDPTTENSGLGGTITADLLQAGVMQCSSCHDVHGVTGVSSLLVKSNAGSALCLTCHDK